jgi:hypothetical protein
LTVINEDGDRPQLRAASCNGGRYLRPVGDVGTQRDGGSACGLDCRDRIRASCGIQIEHADGDAVLGQAQGASRADPSGGSGYDSYLHLRCSLKYLGKL